MVYYDGNQSFRFFMLEPTYREALRDAWHLVWRHKILWIFGILSVVFSRLGISNFVGQIVALDQNSFFRQDYSNFFSIDFWQPLISGWSLWLFLLVAAVGVLAILLSVAAEGALISAAADWYKLGTAPKFNKAWHKGVKHFWRLLVVRVFERIILLALLMLIGYLLSRFVQVDSWFNTIYTAIIFGAGFLIAFTVSAVSIYAAGYIVHDGNSIGAALEKGMMLYRRHVLVSLELSLIELLFSSLTAIFIVVVGFWLLLPSVLLSVIAGLTGYTALISFGIGLTLVLYVLLVALTGAFFHAFMLSSWIYLFMKMHHEGVASRVLHWLGLKRV